MHRHKHRHRHRHSSGDAVLGDEDLLTEILLRLPVKDLLRCKCVCQKWKSLISEPQFCYRHTLGLCPKHNPDLYPSGIMVRPSSRTLEKVHIIPFTNNTKKRFNQHLDVHNKLDGQLRYYVLGSCNGLLLWNSSSKKSRSSRRRELVQECSSFYVSNPTTGYCVRIDRFGHDDSNASRSKPYLVFEPCKSPHYKVIFFDKVVGDREDDELTTKTKLCVYSSETGSWSKHDVLHSFPNNDIINKIIRFHGYYCNDAIHWNLHWITFKFGIWEFDIWELKEDYSGWILRYHVDLTTLRLDLRAYSFDAVLGVVYQPPNEDEEEESVFVMIFVDCKKIVLYNLKNRRSRIIYKGDGHSDPILHGLYFETLISI
ncbi:hypothetical protein PIB30_059762 [Stylosanthes scabra]|uniref:F-box domain-containing protein n=1 Tax=Stylosanthes scabra TaxID=79078 RepID=A0ABU6ZJ43_9FABA|nr:hypothetical protein [Stylosanthes scabra]